MNLSNPTWHPAGDYFAVEASEKCFKCPTYIYGINPASGEFWQIIPVQSSKPAWKNKEQLSFLSEYVDSNAGIYTTNVAQYEPIFFIEADLVEWSTDGTMAAIVSHRYDKQTNKHSSFLSFGNLLDKLNTEIYQTPWVDQATWIDDVVWEFNKKRLIFNVYWYEGDENAENHIYIVDLTSSEINELINYSKGISNIGWLEYSSWIFYNKGQEQELVFFNLDHRCEVRTGIFEIYHPSIAPDGHLIAFNSLDGRIYLLDLLKLFGPDLELLNCAYEVDK